MLLPYLAKGTCRCDRIRISIILDYLVGPNVIAKAVISERGRQECEESESETEDAVCSWH